MIESESTQSRDPASVRSYARVAGVGYLVIILSGIFAEFYVRGSLIVPGDPRATAGNILASESLFRLGIAGDLVMLAADVVVALALYVVFRGVSRGLAMLAAFFRLAQAAALGINLVHLYIPLVLLTSPSGAAMGGASGAGSVYARAFEPDHLPALASLFLEAHSYGYVLGLVFFGFNCLVMGYLIVRSGLVPKVLGVLLLFAGLGYLTDSFGRTVLVDYAQYENAFALAVFVPALIGELAFCLWLLIRGVRIPLRPEALAKADSTG